MSNENLSPRTRGPKLSFDRDEALNAAMRVFWLKGYEGASLSDLTDAMGINKPSLYAQFKDKRRLFLAAIERYQSTVGGPNVQRVLEGHSVRETIDGYFAAINASLTASETPPGCMLNSVATDLAGRDPEIRAQVIDLLVSTEDFLTERFEALGDAPMDERTLAEVIVSFGQSMASRARAGATHADLTGRTDRFLAILLGPDEPVPRN